ncbi:MAG: adenylate kinase [Elusimicrobia bacterium]|nr:adenylate kinase [Elusimicrobiota bacterium]
MPHLIVLGCPGAGKGTQSKVLAARYGLAHIATGDLFRAQIAAKSALGQKVEGYLKAGTLVPDQIVVEMVAGKLDESGQGWLLDGFPRTLEQAQALDKYIKQAGQAIDMVLYLNMDENAVVQRLTARRSCGSCGELYNVMTKPPAAEGKCDRCGGELKQRDDDQESTVRKRLMVYEDLTRPLVAYYRSEHRFHEVDGSLPMDKVTEELTALIDQAKVAG